MPMRKWLGRPKKCPGTAEVSYSVRSRARKSSTLPFVSRRMAVVPNSVRGEEMPSCLARNSFKQRAVGFYNLACALADLLQMFQGDDTQQFGGMRRDGRKQVVQPPHGARQIGLRQNPSAAQAAQTVNLGQTAGDDELRAQMI